MPVPLNEDWWNLLLRWGHMIAGIAWIGTSFYFVALDFSLRKRDGLPEGVSGEAWEVHGGGFYNVQKYLVAPAKLPDDLIWFKWEAYLTWVTGFLLLIVQYYLNASTYLISQDVLVLTPWQAIGISVASLIAGWIIYDLMCRSPLVREAGASCLVRGRAHSRCGLWLYPGVFRAGRADPCRFLHRHHHGGQCFHGDHSEPEKIHGSAAARRSS